MRLIDADAANIYLNSTGVEMIKDMPGIDLPDEYELDRLKELAEADKEGRCLVLPCKVGDTVYEWHYSMITKTIERSEYTVYGIEINEAARYIKSHPLLIVPYGIEILYIERAGEEARNLLIVPYGIEI